MSAKKTTKKVAGKKPGKPRKRAARAATGMNTPALAPQAAPINRSVWTRLKEFVRGYVGEGVEITPETPIYDPRDPRALFHGECGDAIRFVRACSDHFGCNPGLTYDCREKQIADMRSRELLGNTLGDLAIAIHARKTRSRVMALAGSTWDQLLQYTRSYMGPNVQIEEATPIFKSGGPTNPPSLFYNDTLNAVYYVRSCSDHFGCNPRLTYDTDAVADMTTRRKLGNTLQDLSKAIADRT